MSAVRLRDWQDIAPVATSTALGDTRRANVAEEVGVVAAAVWTVRDGKVAKAAFYLSRSAPLEAVRLSH